MDSVALLNDILAKASSAGPSALTERERQLFYVNVLLIEYDMGGLSGFLYNTCWSDTGPEWSAVAQTISALNAFDATPIAQALTRALDILRVPPTASAETWQALLAQADPANEIDALDSQIATATEPVWARLYAEAEKLLAAGS